jgi:hypothetical protein
MSTITINRAAGLIRQRPGAVAARLAGAEFLKVRKRRGLAALTAMLTVGAVVIAGIVLAVLHAADPAKYGPAGGLANLANAAYILSSLGAVAAGVFRDLVATGRSRLALFAARIPGGLALLWPLVAVSWAAACAGSVLLAGSHPQPGLAAMIEGGGWVLLAATVSYLMALGLAALAGSRSATVAILLAWQFAVTPLALDVAKLGVLREGLLTAGLDRMIPAGLLPGARPDLVSPHMSVIVAVTVIAAWAVVPLAAGAWRTCTRDA